MLHVMLVMALLAERPEITIMIVGGIMVKMSNCQYHFNTFWPSRNFRMVHYPAFFTLVLSPS